MKMQNSNAYNGFVIQSDIFHVFYPNLDENCL